MKYEEMTKEQLLKEIAKLQREITQVKEETERKKEEEIVIPSEKSFQNLIDSFNEVIYRADPNTLCATYVNRSIEILYGYTVEEWMSNPHLWEQTIQPDDKEHVFSAISEAQRNFNNTVLEYRIIRKDGSLRWVRDNISWEQDRMGNISSLIGVTYDITDHQHMLRELSDSKEHYHSLLDISPDAIVETGLDGKILFSNQQASKMHGYESPADLIGQDSRQLMHEEDIHIAQKNAEQLLDKGYFKNSTFRIRKKDGTLIPVEVSACLLRNAEGTPKSFIGYLRDITERKKTEDVINKIFNMTGYMVCTADLIGNFTRVNKSFEQILGYTSEELLGQPYINFIHPDDKQKTLDVIENKMSQGIKIVGFENRYRCKDRTYKWLSWTAQPDPKTGESYAIAYDITERKKAHEELAKSEERFRLLSQTSPVGVFITDVDGKTTYWNDRLSEITGMTAKQANGTGWVDAVHPDDIKGVFDEWYRSAESRANFKAKYRFVDRQGNETWTIGQAVPMINDKNELIGYIGTITDINDLKKAEQDQERLTAEIVIKNKELEQLLYVTSHDLRSPLVNIDGYSNELNSSFQELSSSVENQHDPEIIKEIIAHIIKEDIPKSLHYIQTSVTKMKTLLNGILSLSRLGSSTLKTEAIDMNQMIIEIVDNHRFRLNELNINVDVSKLPDCKGDSSQINQVFSNLMDNAIKYSDTERSSSIKISGYKDKHQSVYCMEDTGIGIASNHKEKIFEIFYQLNPKMVKGDGMGLTIVHRIIDKHHGRIWVESEPGRGSRFFVSLPS